jgi:cytochrome c-type biogenesis protein
MIHEWLDAITIALGNNLWLAPLLALVAGLLTSITPCSLTSVPLIINYVGGYADKNVRRALSYSLVFCLGMTITFAVLGIAASLLGRLLIDAGMWWFIILGIVMVLMAMQMWEIINIIPQTSATSKNTKRGYIGALLTGLLGGLFSSHCALPVLIVLLAMVAKTGSVLYGAMLLLIYSLGHSVLLVIAGTSIGFVKKISESKKYAVFNKVFKIILGAFILAIAFYMFYLSFEGGLDLHEH